MLSLEMLSVGLLVVCVVEIGKLVMDDDYSDCLLFDEENDESVKNFDYWFGL